MMVIYINFHQKPFESRFSLSIFLCFNKSLTIPNRPNLTAICNGVKLKFKKNVIKKKVVELL